MIYSGLHLQNTLEALTNMSCKQKEKSYGNQNLYCFIVRGKLQVRHHNVVQTACKKLNYTKGN